MLADCVDRCTISMLMGFVESIVTYQLKLVLRSSCNALYWDKKRLSPSRRLRIDWKKEETVLNN